MAVHTETKPERIFWTNETVHYFASFHDIFIYICFFVCLYLCSQSRDIFSSGENGYSQTPLPSSLFLILLTPVWVMNLVGYIYPRSQSLFFFGKMSEKCALLVRLLAPKNTRAPRVSCIWRFLWTLTVRDQQTSFEPAIMFQETLCLYEQSNFVIAPGTFKFGEQRFIALNLVLYISNIEDLGPSFVVVRVWKNFAWLSLIFTRMLTVC